MKIAGPRAAHADCLKDLLCDHSPGLFPMESYLLGYYFMLEKVITVMRRWDSWFKSTQFSVVD